MSKPYIWEPEVLDLLDDIGTLDERRNMRAMLFDDAAPVPAPPPLFTFPSKAPTYDAGEWDWWQRSARPGWSSFLFDESAVEYAYVTNSRVRPYRVRVLQHMKGIALSTVAVRVWMDAAQVERMNEWMDKRNSLLLSEQ